MGRLRVLNNPAERNPDAPGEWNTEGCPGAWYRSAFAISVSQYERILSDGGFSENLALTRSDDRLLLEAVSYLETQRIRARNHYEKERAAHLKRTTG